MARKKTQSVASPASVETQNQGAAAQVAVESEDRQSDAAPADPAMDQDGPREEPPKHWGPPYKAIFTCPEKGFELGENRRFKQRVFLFAEKPDTEIMAALKENGFTYRGEEKSWTVPATALTRKLTDDLARTWAGPNYVQSMER